MNDHDLPTDEDYPAVSTVYEVFVDFLRGIEEVVDKGQFERLVFGRVTLDSDGLEFPFKPHAFTRENLVSPLLDALDLDQQPEPKIKGTDVEGRPDIELINTNIPIIGEIKPVNAINSGVDQINCYLSAEDCDTPYGILTDGVEWRVYGPPPQGGAGGFVIRESVSLRNTLPAIADRCEILRMRGYTEDTKADLLIPMTQFVRKFQHDHLNRWTLVELPKERREQFMTGDIYFQPAISDYSEGE